MDIQAEQEVQKGDFCFLANIKAYLKQYGLEYEEYWLGGVVGVMGFYYTTLTKDIASVIHGRSDEFEGLYEAFSAHLAEPLAVKQFVESTEAKDTIEKLLLKGITPMLWLDEYYLPKAYNYQKNHLWVMAVILEDMGEDFLVFNNEEILFPKDYLKTAARRRGIIEVQYSLSKEIKFKDTPLEIIQKGLLRVVDNLYKEGNSREEFYGLTGMNYFLHHFRECQKDKEIYTYFYEMNRGGGIFKTRRNMKLFLEEINHLYPCPEGEYCTQIYQELEEKWMKISNLIFKLSVCKDKKLQERIAIRMEQVISLEERGAENIRKLVQVL